MKWNFGFGIHALFKDHGGRHWVEFGPFKDDPILTAICLSNPTRVRKEDKKPSHRILQSLGVYRNK